MTLNGNSAVTASDWVRGVAFSILASVIGGASKLSIRKSWLIDARRKQQQQNEEVFSPDKTTRQRQYQSFDSETDFIPLELGSVPSYQQESISSREVDTGCFLSSTDHKSASSCNKSPKMSEISPIGASWLLYLSGMIGMSFLNPLCCVLAMRYASPSILAPFSGLTLVWVVLFSGVAVGEHPGKSQTVACGLIVMGEVLVALFGDHTNGEGMGVEDVLASYDEPFCAFIVLMMLFFIQLGIFIVVCPESSSLRKVAWGSIGGSIAGFQNFLKDALTIFDATKKQSKNSLTDNWTTSLPGLFFLFVTLAALTAFTGLLFLAACMKQYDATYSAAMYVVSFVLSASLISSVHYHTFEHLEEAYNYVMYPLGLITLFLGAFVLAKPAVTANGDRAENASEGGSSLSSNSHASNPTQRWNVQIRMIPTLDEDGMAGATGRDC